MKQPPAASAPSLLVIHPRDNVAVALQSLSAGQTVTVAGRAITLESDIPCGHKVAIAPITARSPVIKYGQPIGQATADIAVGDWVHVRNVRTNLAGVEAYRYQPQVVPPQRIDDGLMFDAFVRPNGEVGIRNELWILPTVACVNGIAESLARQFRETAAGGTGRQAAHGTQPAGGTVDGVYAFTHPYGCSQLGEDHLNTQKILANLARHPNAAGVLVVGLGCENNTMESFRNVLGDDDPDRYRFMITQEVGDELATGVRLLGELAEYAGRFGRQAVPLSKLRVGLKCGGSDGFSGITANPLVGVVCDQLVARGATTALTEVPEMFGAETIFMNRCVDRQVFDRCAAMLNGFKEYFLRYHQPVYENPSAGNKEGGITTLEDKSLGCLQKGGTTPVVDVLPYGGRLTRPGLNFITGPGNDPVSLTALIAAGVHLVLFTTGRGTPMGGPVPTLKISTNTALAKRKSNWIDFDAGRLLEGATMPELARELLAKLIAVASGERTRNEINGFREIAIFKDGVTV